MKKNDSHGSQSASEELALFDEEALDIADYLREEPPHEGTKQGVAALTLGAVGVVYGDIGTSPIYALREALRPISAGGVQPADVCGILAILIWTLFLIVTVKYVLILLRADNRGEGGILALYTLVRLAFGRRSLPVLLLAMSGAALFAGDAIITPAVSVLGAVEGMGLIVPSLSDWVLPVTLVILVGLFAVQAKGTGAISYFFGPITAVWFLVLGGAGIVQIIKSPPYSCVVQSYLGDYIFGKPRRRCLFGDGGCVFGGDGGRGVICGFRPFRAQADCLGVVYVGVSVACADLSGAGGVGVV
jgi:KUP system potassium uptake protein